MSLFTLDYLARLGGWAMAAVLVQGALVWLSWLGWERAAHAWPSQRRHGLACIHFAALAALPALTLLVLQWTLDGMVGAGAPSHASPDEALRAWRAGYRTLVALALPAAGLWLAGAAAMGVRLTWEAWRLSRLRLTPAPPGLIRRVARLTGAKVRVCEAEIASPQVMGLGRPLLALPAGLADRLSAEELDAVLLHELSHVARGDFAWNLAQRLLLAALWFQPVAWMLYGRLRREREVRCDALAVGRGASAIALARALVRLAEAQAGPPLAMALSGRAELSIRLEQLLKPPQGRPVSGRSLGWAVGGSLACLLALGAGRLALLDPAMRDSYVASAFGPTISIQAQDPAGPFAVKVRQGRVVAASLGADPLPPARILQQGGRVILVGGARQPALDLTVSPQGSIFWEPRA